ncbi:MAG: pyruvate kinase [Hirschia sp.]|nr:pyruvate kinase [Hirschia sp.]MBF19980.1 pyruvate kinase [Hirschia sp.]
MTRFSASGRRAKIVATLGPGSNSPDTIRQLANTGVDVFRLNFSHGDHAGHEKAYKAVRRASEILDRPLGILADLQGPKIRVGKFENDEIRLRFHGEYNLVEGEESTGEDIPVPHPEILAALVEGDQILLDDGKLMLTVIKTGKKARVRADTPGPLSNRKGFTVLGKEIPVPALTEKDKKDLAFACELGVDFIALSFVQTRADLLEARSLMQGRGRLLAKIEKPAAIDNLDDIVAEADAIMVARGDLGVEFPPEQVPILQRRVVRASRAAGRPVIVATHMLESMVESLAPTRAEASDVAQAIYQGADAIMLSSETAVGRHPATAVAIMDRIVKAVETDSDYWRSSNSFAPRSALPSSDADVIAEAAKSLAEMHDCDAIFVSTSHISVLSRFSRSRPRHRLITHAQDFTKLGHQALFWGVEPLLEAGPQDQNALMTILKTQLGEGTKVVCILGDDAGSESPGWRIEMMEL